VPAPSELTPLALSASLICLGAAITIVRSFGPRYRVGRLLAVTRSVDVPTALAIAAGDRPAYVAVTGRIDAEDEFEDADHRPLVLRITRFLARRGWRWVAFEVSREAVPFRISEGLEAIQVDHDALDAGLIVIPRVSEGIAGDIGERAPAGLARATPVRAVIEQVSSVEHAVVLGVPTVGSDGTVRLTAGLGRPLVLTTLERDEAMRVLAGGSTLRPRLAMAFFVLGVVLGLVGAAGSLLG
jgi:hypothetical protein